MNKRLKLYMCLVGCRPPGRYTEQHDVFFGIGSSLKELVPAIKESWPEAKGNVHIDAWREVKYVSGFRVEVHLKSGLETGNSAPDKLFFLNLGGYQPGEFEEFHYKMLTVSETLSAAIKSARTTAFYKHTGFKGASAHIDDEYGVDVDDVYKVADILPLSCREKYTLVLTREEKIHEEDALHLGFLQLWKL